MRSRESRCCSPPSPPPREIQNAACRHDHRRGKSAADNITHPLAPSRSPFNSHRNAASPKPVAVVTMTDEPSLSAATSRIHTSAGAVTITVQLASKRDIAKALQGQQAEFGIMRLLPSIKYPTIRCYRSNCRYQVTPHRMSCPCLVSFSVGHYDVLVSTPDSMFSVV